MKKLNGLEYGDWWVRYSWGMPTIDEIEWHKKRRVPLPKELKTKRLKHMKQLHESGAPYAWIGKMYKLSRAQVYRIINNIPNH